MLSMGILTISGIVWNAVMPIHYNTMTDLKAEPKELINELKSKNIDAEVIILNPGESHVLR